MSQERSESQLAALEVSALAWQTVAEVLLRMHHDLDREWTLDQAARTAGYGLHHFAHLFRAVVGEPPRHYLRRLRLERAAHQLVNDPEVALGEVAARAGYGSSEAFIRAFRRAFGQAPARFRRETAERAGMRESAPAPRAHASLRTIPAGLSANARIEAVGPLNGWTALVPSLDDLEAVGGALMALVTAMPLDVPWLLGGIAQPWGWHTQRDKELRVLRLVPPGTPPPAPPLLGWRMPRGWFARFDYCGPSEGIAPACEWIMDHWIPRSGLRAAFGPLFSLLEGHLELGQTRARLHAPIAAIGLD